MIAETSLNASLGLTPFLAIDTRWSLRIADVSPTYSELDGTPKAVPNDIHHHDETLVDVTDPWLIGRLSAVDGDFIGSMRLGFSFPVGRTEPDPYRLGRRGVSHQHLQGGTGTIVPIAGFAMAYRLDPVTIGLNGVGFFNAYENEEGFRAPVRIYAGHRVTVSLAERVVQPFAEVTLGHEGEEYWQGQPGLEGSNVRTELYVGAGSSFMFFDPWTIDVAARARVATLTDAVSFTSYGIFSLGVGTRFDLWDTDEERARETPPEEAPSTAPEVRERRDKGVTTFEKE